MRTPAEKRAYNVEYQRQLREQDRAKHNAYHLAIYHRNRAERIEELGGVCALCGGTENLQLVPKKNPKRLRCASCTMKLRKTFRHGTVYGFMKAKCECMLCLARKLTYNDERNAKRRRVFRKSKNEVPREKWGQMRKPSHVEGYSGLVE